MQSLVSQIQTLQTECKQRQEKLQSMNNVEDFDYVEQLFQEDKLVLRQLQQAVEQLELKVFEEESERRKWLQLVDSSKEMLEHLQNQHRLQLLRWKQWKEHKQRQLLLEEQKLRRRKPSSTPESEIPRNLNRKIYSSLENTKQILTSQVLVTNGNLDRIRKDEELLKATQSQHQSYSEHIQEGAQQLRSITIKSRQSHWKLILSFILFLLVCIFIVYQRLEHSSWFGVASGTRMMKNTVQVTFHGLDVGLRYLWNFSVYFISSVWNFSVYFISSVWDLTLYLWDLWQKKRQQENVVSQHSVLEDFSSNQEKDIDSPSVVSPTLFISTKVSVDENISPHMERNIKDEENQQSIRLDGSDENEAVSSDKEQMEEEENVFDTIRYESNTTRDEEQVVISETLNSDIFQGSEEMEDVYELEENKQEHVTDYSLSEESDESCSNDENRDMSFVTEENIFDSYPIEMIEDSFKDNVTHM